jgi:inner membrane protein involved in colicin E2 resistance
MSINSDVMNTHEIGFTVAWCVIFNVSVISAMLNNYKYAIYVHIVCGTLQFITTFTLSLILLAPYGFDVTVLEDGYLLYVHAILGFILMVAVAFQTASGYYQKLIQKQNHQDVKIFLKIRRTH